MNKFHIQKIVWIAILWSVCRISGQPVVRDVRIHGAREMPENRLIREMYLVKGQPLPGLWPDSSETELIRYYHQQGFFQSDIDSIAGEMLKDSTEIRIQLWIHEGERARVGQYNVSGVPVQLQHEIESGMVLQGGSGFSESLLTEDVHLILTRLENRGYPLAEVHISELDYHASDNTVDVALSVLPGPQIRLGRFLISGNKLTRLPVILREIRLKTGEVYRHDAVQNISDDLQRLGFFDRVDPPEVYFVEDRAVVAIHLKEGNPNTLDGVVGYTPSNDPERPGYFTGQLHFLFRNLAGTGRFFEAFWEKKDKYSQAMRFGYEEPWLRGWPVHAGFYFTQEIRDTTYVDRGWRLRMRYSPSSTISLSVEGGQREILPDSIGSVLYDLAQTRSWVGSLGLDYSTFDDPLNPRKGVRYHTAATFGRKRNLGPAFMDTIPNWNDPVNTRHIEADAEFILPVWGKQVAFIGLHGQEVRSGDAYVPLSEQIRFGGTTSLRGYAEDFFRGSLVSWMNLEYRYLLGHRSRVFAFVDAGMYQRREREKGLIRGEKIGYGFGIRLETRLGVMGVDYGLGQGDDFMQGKVHVGLVNRF